MTAARTHTASVRIPGSHAALAGHFPGRPIVPAVLLLQCVVDEAERCFGAARIASLTQAKFTAPLLPEQTAQLQLVLQGSELRFSVMRDADSVARGTFTLA